MHVHLSYAMHAFMHTRWT